MKQVWDVFWGPVCPLFRCLSIEVTAQQFYGPSKVISTLGLHERALMEWVIRLLWLWEQTLANNCGLTLKSARAGLQVSHGKASSQGSGPSASTLHLASSWALPLKNIDLPLLSVSICLGCRNNSNWKLHKWTEEIKILLKRRFLLSNSSDVTVPKV